jgi:cation:H+ antiporter
MLLLCLEFILILAFMLASAAVFTNAIEHWGKHYGIGKGVLGSIVAAVATALPETMVPIVALFGNQANSLAQQSIVVGAILGAPLMLATLALPIMALAAVPQRGWHGLITPEFHGVQRDLRFIAVALLLVSATLFMPHNYWRFGSGIVMVGLYLSYIYATYVADKITGHDQEPGLALEPLLFARLTKVLGNFAILAQLLLGLLLLLLSAKLLVNVVAAAAQWLHFPALLISLLLIPVATELPEKINSITWIRRQQDTLAVANITGAMVWQITILPILGLSLAVWQPQPAILLNLVSTAAAVFWLSINFRPQGISIAKLLIVSCCYCAYYLICSLL